MIVVIGGEKGGTGKSTLACNLAVRRAMQGTDVLLLDTDIQASSSNFATRRDEEGLSPRIACIQKFGKGLQHEVGDLAKRYHDIIIDAGGRDSVELRAALVVSEKLFIPIQASQFDIDTLDKMDEIVATARGFNPGLAAYVVINRATPNPVVADTQEAADFIHDFENLKLAKSVVRERIAFKRCVKEGRSIVELVPNDTKACAELDSLFQEIFHVRIQTSAKTTIG